MCKNVFILTAFLTFPSNILNVAEFSFKRFSSHFACNLNVISPEQKNKSSLYSNKNFGACFDDFCCNGANYKADKNLFLKTSHSCDKVIVKHKNLMKSTWVWILWHWFSAFSLFHCVTILKTIHYKRRILSNILII